MLYCKPKRRRAMTNENEKKAEEEYRSRLSAEVCGKLSY
jgi:hypothetical protein